MKIMRLTTKTLVLATLAASLAASPALAVDDGTAGAVEQNPAARRPQGPLITPQRIDLRVEVRPELPAALIEADFTFRVERTAEAVSVFLRPDMNLDVIEDADGVPLAYSQRRSRIRISTPSLDAGVVTTWRFRYRATFDAPLAESGQILFTTPWYPHLRVTANSEEFLRFVPMPMSLTATLPDPWVLVSSGTNTVTDENGATTYVWRDSVPSQTIPLVIGRFVEDDKLATVGFVRAFFDRRNSSLTESYVEYIVSAATFFSERIGVLNRRSWNLVAVDLPETMSGLTLPGMTLLDVDAVSREMAFPYRLLAHEIAHQWWNSYIEIPRGRDAWLREGLPTYSSLMFLESEYGTRMMRQELDRSQRVALSIASPEPLENGFDMSSPEAIYALNYHKAAAVLHMLREIMGLDKFIDLIRALHNLEEDVTTSVFVRLAEETYAGDLSWFFNAWLRSADVPSFRVRYGYVRVEAELPRYELRGVIEQQDAAIRYPVRMRVSLEAAPPLETTVWIEPGSVDFSISLPSPPTGLQFDPDGDLLHREVSVEIVAPLTGRGESAVTTLSPRPARKEEPPDGAADGA